VAFGSFTVDAAIVPHHQVSSVCLISGPYPHLSLCQRHYVCVVLWRYHSWHKAFGLTFADVHHAPCATADGIEFLWFCSKEDGPDLRSDQSGTFNTVRYASSRDSPESAMIPFLLRSMCRKDLSFTQMKRRNPIEYSYTSNTKQLAKLRSDFAASTATMFCFSALLTSPRGKLKVGLDAHITSARENQK